MDTSRYYVPFADAEAAKAGAGVVYRPCITVPDPDRVYAAAESLVADIDKGLSAARLSTIDVVLLPGTPESAAWVVSYVAEHNPAAAKSPTWGNWIAAVSAGKAVVVVARAVVSRPVDLSTLPGGVTS